MDNLVLITSVINTPNVPFSYSKIRSVFTRDERFEQTKKTIESIKEKIPNHKIMIVECTDFNEIEKNYFENNCDYILNLWEQKELHSFIFSLSKALGEGTMTIKALEYTERNNLQFKNLFKICGRYQLNEKFDYPAFNTDKLICNKINNKIDNINTWLYKMPHSILSIWKIFLINNIPLMKQCIGYEVLFGKFLKYIDYKNVKFYEIMGCNGYNAMGTLINK